jgi:hypothetical protein
LGYWTRHDNKEGEAALNEIHNMGWLIESPNKHRKYYCVKCPCKEHQRRVHKTPSNPRHFREAVAWCKRQTCMSNREEAR